MDGENTTCYLDGYLHACSPNGGDHPSRAWAKRFGVERAHLLPYSWRLCAENLAAVHSIHYERLPGYLLGFSVWTAEDLCLSWDDTRRWLDTLDIPHPPILFERTFDRCAIELLHTPKRDDATREGYVVCLAEAFPMKAFNRSVAKYVHRSHVQSNRPWAHGAWTPNGLA